MGKPLKLLFVNSGPFNAGAEKSMKLLAEGLTGLGHTVEILFLYNAPGRNFFDDLPVRKRYVGLRWWSNYYKSARNPFLKIIYASLYLCSKIIRETKGIGFRQRKYDAVIINKSGIPLGFVFRHLKSDKYFQYIRVEMTEGYLKGGIRSNIMKHGDRMDGFICVSNKVKDTFLGYFPEFEHKTNVVYNLSGNENVLEMAEGEEDPFAGFRDKPVVVTVARIQDRAKGIFRSIDVFRVLKDRGFDFRWVFIGYGPDIGKARELVSSYKLDEDIFFLGNRDNPYPYIRHADIVAVLSFYEGFCRVIGEAKTLKRAVIATDFAGAREQLTDDINGLIVDNDINAIVKGMKKLLSDSKLRDRIAAAPINPGIPEDRQKTTDFVNLIIN